MPFRAVVTSVSLIAAGVIWGLAVGLERSLWKGWSAVWLGTELVVLTAVSVVGMLVGAARWARRLGIAAAAFSLGTATVSPFAWWWAAGVVAAAVALAGLVGTGMKGLVRERPAAAGPPAQAVVLALLLVATPGIVAAAVTEIDAPTAVLLGVVLVFGGWYAKAAPGALLVVRAGAPLVLAAVGLLLGWPAGTLPGFLALLVGWLAWTQAARVAVRPLVERGTAVPIPAELTPKEILDAAGLDERGRRKEQR